jgi:hypothetical protein
MLADYSFLIQYLSGNTWVLGRGKIVQRCYSNSRSPYRFSEVERFAGLQRAVCCNDIS